MSADQDQDLVDELAAARERREWLAVVRALGYCRPCAAIVVQSAETGQPFALSSLCDPCHGLVHLRPAPMRYVPMSIGYSAPALRPTWWRRLLAWVRSP